MVLDGHLRKPAQGVELCEAAWMMVLEVRC